MNKNNALSWKFVLTVGLLPLVATIISQCFGIWDKESTICVISIILMLATILFGVFLYAKGKLTTSVMIKILILLGVIFRIGYMLYTPYNIRSHDVGSLTDNGHLGYIIRYLAEFRLPQSNGYQFYHPPFYHFVSAMLVRIVALFCGNSNYSEYIKYAATVSCVAGSLSLVIFQKITEEFKINDKAQCVAIAAMAFFPSLMFMSGRVNNDALVTMFMLLVILFTVKWYYDANIKNIIFLAISMGFGMMTKISCEALAIAVAPVMLYKLYKSIKEKNCKDIIIQLAIFALICFPLGLWYPIRNMIRFNQPLNFVHDINNSAYFNGNESIFNKFIKMPIGEIFNQPFAMPTEDHNMFMNLTRTAVFGEFTFNNPKWIAITLYFLNVLVILISLICTVIVFVKDKSKDYFKKYFLFAIGVILFISYIIFNIKYPYFCTTDARYLPITFISGYFYIARAYDLYYVPHKKANGYMLCGVEVIILYCIFAAIMYV